MSTRARRRTRELTTSSSLLSWTNWTAGQGDDQGPTVRRSERSEGLGASSGNRESSSSIRSGSYLPYP
nr:MAG TPA: hypothetical protein [Caudoviricetes sp.]